MEIFSFVDVKMGSNGLIKFPQQNKSFCFVVLQTCRNHGQECEIHHAQQGNVSLKLVANLTQSWSFIPLVLIISELLPKITKSEQKIIESKANPEQKWRRDRLQSRSQSLRYPCPAERENEDLWDEAFPITGFLLFRSNCAGVSV